MVTISLLARKRILVTVNAALAAGILACIVLTVLLPAKVEKVESPKDRDISVNRQESRQVGPLKAYAVIYRRDLRKPLFDPKPVIPLTIEPPRPKLAVRLVGTAVEPGFTYGLFRTKSGRTELVSVGQKIEGAEVVSVGDGTATVKFAGELITLKVEPKEGNR